MMVFAYSMKAIVELFMVHLFSRTAFHARPRNKKNMIASMILLILIQNRILYRYSIWQASLVHMMALLMIAFTYQTKRINCIFTALFAFCVNVCSYVIIFWAANYMSVQIEFVKVQQMPIVMIAWIVTASIITVSICKMIEVYHLYPKRSYVSIILIEFCLILLAVHMFFKLPYIVHKPTAIINFFLVLLCIGLCIGLLRDQLHVQAEHSRLEFLEQHNADQVAHYASLYKNDQDIQKIRHDLKNFIIGAQGYLQQQEYEKLDRYLSQFLGSIQPSEFIDTGNPLLDAVMTAKRADAPQIPFEVSVPRLAYTEIDPMDVAMLLATALDNAIEGCEGYEQPYIRIKMIQQGKTLSVLVQNPTNHPVREKNHRLITQKDNFSEHGYGVPGMQRIASKYHGHLNWSLQEEIFSLRVLLQDLKSDKG